MFCIDPFDQLIQLNVQMHWSTFFHFQSDCDTYILIPADIDMIPKLFFLNIVMIIIVVVVVIVGIVCKVTQGCSKLHSTLCKKKVDNLNVFYLNVWVFFSLLQV